MTFKIIISCKDAKKSQNHYIFYTNITNFKFHVSSFKLKTIFKGENNTKVL